MSKKKGAGIIPFTQKNNTSFFLFHKTFKGRRSGLLVDFGGGSNEGESYQQTAIREFIEETEAMFFAADIKTSDKDSSSQSSVLAGLLHKTQQRHPGWWCSRRRLTDQSLKDWKTFFVEVGYKDLSLMNKAWATDTAHRFVKRREWELLWISKEELINIIEQSPEKLWDRVRELDNLKALVLEISTSVPSTPTIQPDRKF